MVQRVDGPFSTISPAYITAPRVQSWATIGRSCVTRISARPSSRAERVEQLEDLRLHHHVERRRRLVGDQHLRVARQRHRDRRALAHAAGELVRVARGAARPGSRPTRAARRARSRAAAPCAVSCVSSASTICEPIVRTGLSAFIAPWKTIAMSTQRCGRIELSPPREDVLAVRAGRSPAALAFGGSSPSSASAVVVLPQPGLADEPEALAGLEREARRPGRRAARRLRRGRTRRAGPRPRAAARSQRLRALGRRAAAAGTCARRGARRAGAG